MKKLSWINRWALNAITSVLIRGAEVDQYTGKGAVETELRVIWPRARE